MGHFALTNQYKMKLMFKYPPSQSQCLKEATLKQAVTALGLCR